MKNQLLTLLKYRYLLADLVARDLKVKYRRSFLGFLWSILNPLLMMLVVTAVFQNFFRIQIDNFPIYYLTGVLIFNFVSEGTSTAMDSIIHSAPLIRKVYIPKYIFPLQKVCFAFVNMLFSLVAVVIMILILRFPIGWTALLFPIPMLYALVFCIGLGLLLAALNVFFRDIGHLWSVFITAWMYLTPIIYPMDMANIPQFVLVIIRLNPMYYYVDYFRQVVMYGNIPGLTHNLICIGCSLVSLILGVWVFKVKQDRFILYV